MLLYLTSIICGNSGIKLFWNCSVILDRVFAKGLYNSKESKRREKVININKLTFLISFNLELEVYEACFVIKEVFINYNNSYN